MQWRHGTWGASIDCGETNEKRISLDESTEGGGMQRAWLQSAKAGRSTEIRRKRGAGQLSQDMMREIVRRCLALWAQWFGKPRIGMRACFHRLTLRRRVWPVCLIGPRRETQFVQVDRVGSPEGGVFAAMAFRLLARWRFSLQLCRQRGSWCSVGFNGQISGTGRPESVKCGKTTFSTPKGGPALQGHAWARMGESWQRGKK
jgi:hypothetical protein